jgi:hypothetical protein
MTGNFVNPTFWPYYNLNFGYTILGLGLGAVFSLILSELARALERRPLLSRAEQAVKEDMTRVMLDVKRASGADRSVMAFPWETSNNDMSKALGAKALAEMDRLSNDANALRNSVDQELFQGTYGTTFFMEANRLKDIQLKYASILDSGIMALLADAERLLDRLDMHLTIVLKNRKFEEDASDTLGLARKLKDLVLNDVYDDIQNLLKLLTQAIRNELIEKPSN